MKLFSAATSPFARKVRVCIDELGLANQVEIVPVSGSPIDAGTMPLDVNPLGKLPCLISHEDQIIYDSRIITRYLNDFAGGLLYPRFDNLWTVLTLEATGEGMMEAALSITYEERLRPEPKRFDEWADGQWGKIDRAISMLEERSMDHLKGPIDMAQVAVGCALGYLDLRHDARNWRKGHDVMATWFEEFNKTPSMAKTDPNNAS